MGSKYTKMRLRSRSRWDLTTSRPRRWLHRKREDKREGRKEMKERKEEGRRKEAGDNIRK